MIVSHKHRFIFIKTKKTGGTSVEIALSKICGPHDIITEINPEDEVLRKEHGGLGRQNDLVPLGKYTWRDLLKLIIRGQRKRFYNHMSATDIRRYLPDNVWTNYFKFAVERNPFDKVYSHYWWRGGDERYGSFQKYLDSGDYRLVRGEKYYKSEKGDKLVDAIYKLEEIDQELATLSDRLKLDLTSRLSVKNIRSKMNIKMQRTPKSDFWNTKNKTAVRRFFADEFALLYHSSSE